MATISLLIASQIKGGKLDRYQSLQIKAIIQIPVKITETLAVSKAGGQKIGKWTGNGIKQIQILNIFVIAYFRKGTSPLIKYPDLLDLILPGNWGGLCNIAGLIN